MTIQRSFKDIPEGKLEEADQQSFLVSLGWSKALHWEELLRSRRILLISEAGAGKTYECQQQQRKLWDDGEPAFFIELSTLASSDLRSELSLEEEQRLDAWLLSQSEVATFFLDSIDELKITQASFERALKRLRKALEGQLWRTRFVITTRPIPFDKQAIKRQLPIEEAHKDEPSAETFARVVMQMDETPKERSPADWRTVALMPLSDAQIMEFARNESIENPEAFLNDLHERNAQEFARRPQDLIEQCADWRIHKRIRTHLDQVSSNVRIKLKPNENREEFADLSGEKAFEGASRLALAMMVTRRLTLRHNAEADTVVTEVALDPATILSDWSAKERQSLLSRPLFGFASYGRVRFHHRSVAEYMAAQRLRALRTNGMTTAALKRLLFAEVHGKIIVRPSKRPIAGWLALTDPIIFGLLRDHEPAALLNEGDPESLAVNQRCEALRAYVKRYGQGSWRGLNAPFIQLHRFSSPELAPEINRLWTNGIENSEIREILLQLIERGSITNCSDIAYKTARDSSAADSERLIALEALAAIGDCRLEEATTEIASDSELWPDRLARGAIVRLFPKHLTVEQLCEILARVEVEKRIVGDLDWHLPRIIAEAEMNTAMLEELRDGLYQLIFDGLKWQREYPRITSDRSHLTGALAATCLKGLHIDANPDWLQASALAAKLNTHENRSEEVFVELRKRLINLSADQNAILFWATDAISQSQYESSGWERLGEIISQGPVQLNFDRDLGWATEALIDHSRPSEDRALMLQVAMRLSSTEEGWRDHLVGLRCLVADQSELLTVIDERLKPAPHDKTCKQLEKKSAALKKKHMRRQAKNYASWVTFWREIAENPDAVFSTERSEDSAWNLWLAMSKINDSGRASGWNRLFLETHLNKEIADRLRINLMQYWRKVSPLLESERSGKAKKESLLVFRMALAGIYAEAEDPKWASKLSDDEAKLAARYAPLELNGFPLWLDDLIALHPDAVQSILGKELSRELSFPAEKNWHSRLLQNVKYAPESVAAAFTQLIFEWFIHADSLNSDEDEEGAAKRLEQVVEVLIKHGNTAIKRQLSLVAETRLRENAPRAFTYVWLPALMRLNAAAGVEILERICASIEPAKNSEAVSWFATLFGDRFDNSNLSDPMFTPPLLLRLLRLAYQHVRREDDNVHDSCYTPDKRDHAERGRGEILGTLLKAKGEEGWAAKLELASDPLCAHFKDRIIALAEESLADEIDADVYDDAQAIELDKKGEMSPTSNEAMFAIMRDRLSDIDELLMQDASPRAAWASINDEKIMRREIARELQHNSNGLYIIDQECVTADEKETDIRLCSTASNHIAVIELKLGNMDRSARKLRDTLRSQLVTKYMGPETRRSGCLLITLKKTRQWEHPDTGALIAFDGLIQLLKNEAIRLEQSMGGMHLHVHALDLRPRLATEKELKQAP